MSNHGYKQLVTHPTTDKGTLIDHDIVYFNRPSSDIIVEIHDTFIVTMILSIAPNLTISVTTINVT